MSSFKLEVFTDHDKKQTMMRLYEYDKIISETEYNQTEDYFLLCQIIDRFKGKDTCKDDYWSRPLHDPYAIGSNT